jgi:hypothetical protein
MRLGIAGYLSYFVPNYRKTKSMANRKIAGMQLLLAVSILSCKKDYHNSPGPADKKLVVKLENQALQTLAPADGASGRFHLPAPKTLSC